ncbi:MAG TPA: hypothetical protein VF041_20815 [Gemmatimonadaceae bacterium]
MRANADSAGNLTVTSSESWLVVLAGVLAGGAIAVWFGSQPPSITAAWSAALALGALACSAGWERSRFVFDRRARELVWKRWTPFRRAEGRAPFGEIQSLSLERAFGSHGQRSNAVRLVVHTTGGVIPLTTSYEAARGRYTRIADQIAEAVSAAIPGEARIPIVE